MQGSDTIRTFVAIELPDEVKEHFAKVRDELSGKLHGAKWARPEGIHLTLKFLGNVETAAVPRICDALSGACAGTGRCELTTESLGVFPGPRAARVLWAGCGDAGGRASALQGRIEDALEPLGFERERRAFKPHLTIARFRTPAHVHPETLALRLDKLTFRSGDAVLFRSELKPGGAVYTKLETFPFV